ncbi:MAG: hypothetical protein OXG03_05400 [Gammaproteobacteria bacterium]|nr:hypothetical protein [Gammaproteobacteria bacterium]
MTALYFLKDGLGWRYHWEKIAKTGATCQMTLQHREDLLPPENPLSYCALTNYHKFVTECRQHRSGRMDRNYLYREAERKFFMDVELEAFDPDVVVFQGAGFERKMANLRRAGTRIYVGQHPSARGEGIRKPKVLIEDMLGRL